jgi:hypothetical protein
MAKEFHRSHEDWRKGIGMRLLETEKRQKLVKWKHSLNYVATSELRHLGMNSDSTQDLHASKSI